MTDRWGVLCNVTVDWGVQPGILGSWCSRWENVTVAHGPVSRMSVSYVPLEQVGSFEPFQVHEAAEPVYRECLNTPPLTFRTREHAEEACAHLRTGTTEGLAELVNAMRRHERIRVEERGSHEYHEKGGLRVTNVGPEPKPEAFGRGKRAIQV